MSDQRELLPVGLGLPQRVEELYSFRVQLGKAMAYLMDLKSRADALIAEDMGERTERVVDGVTYSYEGAKSWEATEPLRLLELLTDLQQRGEITNDDYHEAVNLIPQPDVIKFNHVKLKQLVAKRGLKEIDEYRAHREGPRRLKVKD